MASTEQQECDDWNRANQTGVIVDVRMPDGSLLRSRTSSQAWDFYSGTPAVKVRGVGICHLDRVTKVQAVDDTDFDWDRAGGGCTCEACGKTYFDHPDDLDHPGYDGLPWLVKLCDGRLVKL